MPFTPYHFGPSGFIGLALRRWIDVPVFVLANVAVDIEVLVIAFFRLGYPLHRYCHTLLIGLVVGILWGLLAYRLRHLFKRLMALFRIPYQTSLLKMLISGILGVWLHVLIDGIYHFDVRILWPNKAVYLRRMTGYIDKQKIETICLYFFLAAVVPYVLAVISFLKDKRIQNRNNPK